MKLTTKGYSAKLKKYLSFFPLSIKWVMLFLLFSTIPLIVYFIFYSDSSFKDFLLNFGTEMLGVFVSVIIIGWLINKKEYILWNEVDSFINKKYISFYSKTITTFLYLFQMYSNIFPSDKEVPTDKKIRVNQELTFLNGKLINNITIKLKSFDKNKFEMFKEFIIKTEQDLDDLYIYPNRLNNEQIIFLENSIETLDEIHSLMHLFSMNDYNSFQSNLKINSDFLNTISESIEELIHIIVRMRQDLSKYFN